MPALICPCGHSINLSLIPNINSYDVIPDVMREKLIDKIVMLHESYISSKEFEKEVYKIISHLSSPGIVHIIECPVCYNIAVFARPSDNVPVFWYNRKQVNLVEETTTLGSIVSLLQEGELPLDWQNRRSQEDLHTE